MLDNFATGHKHNLKDFVIIQTFVWLKEIYEVQLIAKMR
jgi:hypothetical protein